MDEKTTHEDTGSTTEDTGATAEPTAEDTSEHPRTARDRREFEDRLDGFADKFSRSMSDGVKKLEEAFDKGKDNLRTDMDSGEGKLSGSPRMGMILVGLGIVWLLYALGVLSQPIFPVLLIVLGVYFLLRNR